MTKKDILLTIAVLIFLGLIWLSQRPRLQAYDECYMARMEDWSFDCELGGPVGYGEY